MDDLIEAMAMSDAAFDGQSWLGMGRVARERYKARSAAALSAIHARGDRVVPGVATGAMRKSYNDRGYADMLSASPYAPET